MFMDRKMKVLTVVAVWLTVFGQAAFAQTQTTAAPGDRANTVRKLSKELRWRDAEDHKRYLKIRDERTRRLLREVDGFVAETFLPGTATADRVKAGLDALLSHKKGDLQGSVAFLVNLPAGHFLITGVEVTRGGGAISEDAISFRAYREAGGQFVTVADADYPPYSGDVHEDGFGPLVFLNAEALSSQPVASEFWFIAWAHVASPSPPKVTTYLFGFDGEMFRTLWATDPFITPHVKQAIQVTPGGGFTLRRMLDFRAWTVINEQYAVTVDGPQKVNETETEVR
jgi:hypothetical protein